MVQVVENWASLEGTVRSTRPSQLGPDYVEVDLAVERVEPVEGFRNLFPEAENTVISVTFPGDIVEKLGLRAGDRIRCQARKASPFAAFAKADEVRIVSADR
jgi:hypothetical protein